MTGNLENAHFVMGKLVVKFHPFGAFLVSFLPKACERSFFAAFHFDFNVSCLERLERFDENLAVHNVARLVKGEFSLNLYSPLREVASSVAKVKHLIYKI